MTIQVNLSGEAEFLLKDLAELQDGDLAMTVKKAIATESFLLKHARVGYKILLQCPNGEIQQVILR